MSKVQYSKELPIYRDVDVLVVGQDLRVMVQQYVPQETVPKHLCLTAQMRRRPGLLTAL